MKGFLHVRRIIIIIVAYNHRGATLLLPPATGRQRQERGDTVPFLPATVPVTEPVLARQGRGATVYCFLQSLFFIFPIIFHAYLECSKGYTNSIS